VHFEGLQARSRFRNLPDQDSVKLRQFHSKKLQHQVSRVLDVISSRNDWDFVAR
jgi:hypothetical protein